MTIAIDLGRKATKQKKQKYTKVAFLKFLLPFLVNFEKKSADENKSMINYPACNELTPFQPNCFVFLSHTCTRTCMNGTLT